MSKTVDQKVVEMRFENSNFEKNAATSIGTLAKLKQSLNLTGASKGLEQVNAAAGKVNMKGLGSAVETVTAKFSALQVMGVTALARITNDAITAGKNFVNALTIAPVKDGFSEYEMTLNAVQTTMAGTGKTAKEVEKELKKLDEYADKTVYSTADMLNNLPKFTNAGVALEDATKAMIGIANATALAGGDAGKASIAFYNLGQAIGTGYLTRMDYNSINNAGIATMEWKEQMVDAAIAMGTLTQVGDDAYQAGNKTLTLQQLFIDGLQEQWATTDVMMKVFGDYGDETTEVGQKAYSAAQDIKTFSMMMDSLKATAGTGWKDTWQIIFGGLDDAKKFWTGLNNFISGIVTSMSDFRNELLEKALGGGPFAKISERIQELIKPAQKATEAIQNTISTIENLDEIAYKVIRGEYMNTNTGRREKLMADGYNWAIVQNRVNELLGNTKRHSVEAAEAELQLYKAEHGLIETGNELDKTSEDLNETRAETIEELMQMTDAQLKELGLTEEEIDAFRRLAKMCEQAGISMDDFLKDPSLLNGRTLLINAFKNLGEGMTEFAEVARIAWQSIFPPKTIDERADRLYKLIAAFHKFTIPFKNLIDDNGELTETGDKLARTFRGIFAIIGIITDIVGGAFKLAFKVVNAVLKYFNLNLLDVTAIIGDALVKFREMININGIVARALDFVVPAIKGIINAVKKLVEVVKKLPLVQKIVTGIKNAFENLKATNFKEIGKNIIEGLKNGLGDGADKVIDKIVEIGKKLIEGIKEILGIHSPSKVMFAIGGFIIAGLIGGLLAGSGDLAVGMQAIVQKCVDFFSSINWGNIFAIGISVGMVYFVKKIADVFSVLVDAGEAIANILDNCALVVKNFAKLEKAIAFNFRMDGVKKLAIAVAILAASVIALTFVDQTKLLNAVGVIVALSVILIGLAWAMNKLSEASISYSKDNGLKIGGFKTALLTIAASLLILAIVVKMIGKMDPDQVKQGFLGLAGIVIAIGVVLFAFNKFAKGSTNLDKAGIMLRKMAVTMLILVIVAKLLAGMEWDEMGKAAAGLLGLAGIMSLLMLISKIGNAKKIGNMLLSMAGAMALLVIVAKMIVRMPGKELLKASIGIGALVGIMAVLMLISKIGNTKKIGNMLLSMAGAMALLVIVAKMLARMEWGEMGKAVVGLLGLAGVVAVLVAIVKSVEKDAPKIAGTLLAMSISIGILAMVAVMLSLMDLGGLAKGIAAVGLLSSFMALMAHSTKGAVDCKSNLIVMTIAIAVMAGAVAALSMIDPAKLAIATGALGLVMGMFTLMIAATKNAQKCMGNLIVMTLAIAVMANILYVLADLPVESTLGAAVALSTMMLAMSVALLIVSEVGKHAKDALLGALALTAMAVPLLAFVGVLAVMQNVEASLGNVMALIALATAMTLLLIPLTIVGAFGTSGAPYLGALALLAMAVPLLAFVAVLACMQNVQNAMSNTMALTALATAMTLLLIPLTVVGAFGLAGLPYLGVLALTAMAVPLLAFVGVLACMQNIKNAEANTKVLIELMTVLTGMLTIVAILGPLALVGTIALAALTGVIVAIGAVVIGIGALMDTFPKLEEFLDKGIPILEKVGTALGSFIGGIMGGIASGLPTVADHLSKFMENLQPFVNGAKELVPGTFDGIKALAEAVLILTAAEIMEGMTRWITGGNSLAEFGDQLGDLGTDLRTFVTNLGTFDDNTVNTVTCAANAIKALAQAASELPKEGGLAALFAGENSISEFGDKLPGVGTNLAAFATNLGTFDDNTVSTITCAANAIKGMAEAAKNIPRENGLAQLFAGDKSISSFAANMPSVGTNLAAFATNLGTFDDDKVATVTCAANALKAMADAAKSMDGQAEWAKKLFGDNSLGGFSDQLAGVATDLKAFVTNLGTFTEEQVESARTAVLVINVLSYLAETDLKKAKKHLPGLGEALPEFATNLSTFCSSMPTTSTMETAVSNMKKLLDAVKNFSGTDPSVVADFAYNLSQTGTYAVELFVAAFTNDSAAQNVSDAGVKLIDNLIKGVESKTNAFKSAGKLIATKGANAAANARQEFKAAGKNLGEGLVEGIEAKEDAAYDAGYALGQAAVQGEKDGQQSKSPSKLTIQAGKWLGEGLIVGMEKMLTLVYNSGKALGNEATSPIRSAIARIGETLSSDIDAQPTIRPVLDLSEVTAGVGTLNSMLDTSPSIGLMTNLGSISSLTNSRQNGNSDVVMAIEKLGKALNKLPSGDTYSINGITYDDGSNITNAVKDLVRAARMEGRV